MYCDSHNSIVLRSDTAILNILLTMSVAERWERLRKYVLIRHGNKSFENLLAHCWKRRTSYRLKNTWVLAQVQPTSASYSQLFFINLQIHTSESNINIIIILKYWNTQLSISSPSLSIMDALKGKRHKLFVFVSLVHCWCSQKQLCNRFFKIYNFKIEKYSRWYDAAFCMRVPLSSLVCTPHKENNVWLSLPVHSDVTTSSSPVRMASMTLVFH